jgi:SpoVK/Ycf46/Vps4 family AAA+-type ATPase
MSVTAPSLEKMNDTVQKLREMVSKMDTYSQAELNRAEDKIRNEFQVIEAMLAYVGRDIYAVAQRRRMELRDQNIREAREAIEYLKTAKPVTEEKKSGRTRSSRSK